MAHLVYHFNHRNHQKMTTGQLCCCCCCCCCRFFLLTSFCLLCCFLFDSYDFPAFSSILEVVCSLCCHCLVVFAVSFFDSYFLHTYTFSLSSWVSFFFFLGLDSLYPLLQSRSLSLLLSLSLSLSLTVCLRVNETKTQKDTHVSHLRLTSKHSA